MQREVYKVQLAFWSSCKFFMGFQHRNSIAWTRIPWWRYTWNHLLREEIYTPSIPKMMWFSVEGKESCLLPIIVVTMHWRLSRLIGYLSWWYIDDNQSCNWGMFHSVVTSLVLYSYSCINRTHVVPGWARLPHTFSHLGHQVCTSCSSFFDVWTTSFSEWSSFLHIYSACVRTQSLAQISTKYTYHPEGVEVVPILCRVVKLVCVLAWYSST
jgi:hypothetical protein